MGLHVDQYRYLVAVIRTSRLGDLARGRESISAYGAPTMARPLIRASRSALHSMVDIQIDPDGTLSHEIGVLIIVHAPTGVIYHHQCGGAMLCSITRQRGS